MRSSSNPRTTRADRQAFVMDPAWLDEFRFEEALWRENEAETLASEAWKPRKELLLVWLEANLKQTLKPKEVECIRCLYLRGYEVSRQELARELGVNPTTIGRLSERAIKRLRAVAETNPELRRIHWGSRGGQPAPVIPPGRSRPRRPGKPRSPRRYKAG